MGSLATIECAAVCEDAACSQVSGVCGPPQMMSTDKDFCFMATDDLMMEVQVDSINQLRVTEQKVVQSVLWLLEDKNADLALRR